MDSLRKYKLIVALLFCALVVESCALIRLSKKMRLPRQKEQSVVKKYVPVRVIPGEKPKPKNKGKIAIVLDDWGYNLNNISAAQQIKYPLTIAILPQLPYSKEISQVMHNSGFEVIIHLPMEPYEKIRLEKHTLMTGMNGAAIGAILDNALTDVLYAKGVSNHMGSKATTDLQTMNALFPELKKRKLYFLDSYVSSNSVCSQPASKYNVPFAQRDIFLDNESNSAYIKQQLYKLKSKARMYGEAIGIGHDRKNTLAVLKEVMPELENEGFSFVFLSALVE